MSKPLALTEEQIKALEHRVTQRWQIHRGDMEALIAMARERNVMVAGQKPASSPFPATYSL